VSERDALAENGAYLPRMISFVHQYAYTLAAPDGRQVVARVYADRQTKGTLWEAWFVFFPLDGSAPWATDSETTQPRLDDVSYWATGISPTYLEGALNRALDSKLHLARRSGRMDEVEYAEEELKIYERARPDAISLARAHLDAVGVPPP
jgi:hypothetical protein